jgi:hypothetical protein
MSSIDIVLRELVEEYGYVCGIATTGSGQVLARHGDFTALSWPDLPNSLFGDQDAIVRLDQSLDGQILPQVFAQGEVTALVMKPQAELIIGLFDQSGQDVTQIYLQGRRVSQDLSARLGRAEKSEPGG